MGQNMCSFLRLFIASLCVLLHKKQRRYPLRRFKDKKPYAIDLAPYTREFSRVAQEEESATSVLSVKLWSGTGYLLGLYRDTPYGFILCRGSVAVACVGFHTANDAVIIRQIQGAYGQSETLVGLRWERMLVALVIDWAREVGFSRVKIQRGECNGYYSGGRSSSLPALPAICAEQNRRLKRRYNGTARACGFKSDPTDTAVFLRLI